jgi:hypothetical protein
VTSCVSPRRIGGALGVAKLCQIVSHQELNEPAGKLEWRVPIFGARRDPEQQHALWYIELGSYGRGTLHWAIVARGSAPKGRPIIRPLRAPSLLRASPREAAATAPPQSLSDASSCPILGTEHDDLSGRGAVVNIG